MDSVQENLGEKAERGSELTAPFGLEPSVRTPVEVALSGGTRVPYVCICGHSIGSHHEMAIGGWYCSNGRLWCPCERPLAVLEVPDLRDFHFRTYGSGDRHALTLGVQRSLRNGRLVRQLIDNACFKCQEVHERLIPTSLSNELAILEYPGPRNALLCPDCWSGLPSRGY
jgi:hypothetical protein